MLTLFRKKGSGFENVAFRRVIGSELRPLWDPSEARRGAPVTLVPMRSLSLDAFSFPFANATAVREALRTQITSSYASAGEVELFPVVIERVGRGVSGVVWYLPPGELSLPQDDGESEAGGLVWPAPLPLVSKVDGTGVTLWMDEENLCSLLWQGDRPVLSRWRPRSRSTPEAELAWFDAYCLDRELDRGETFAFDATDEEACRSFGDIARESLARLPWLASVNLSRRALEGAMGLERSVRIMTRAACWLLLMGALVLGGSLLRWGQVEGRVADVRARSEALYREAFDPAHTGRVGNPVALARDKIAALQGGSSEARSLGDVLADLGAIFTEDPSLDITVDVLRYYAEGLDCAGLAPDMSTVLTFRRAWEGRSAQSQLSNTQSVPGVGYRFDLRVKW